MSIFRPVSMMFTHFIEKCRNVSSSYVTFLFEVVLHNVALKVNATYRLKKFLLYNFSKTRN